MHKRFPQYRAYGLLALAILVMASCGSPNTQPIVQVTPTVQATPTAELLPTATSVPQSGQLSATIDELTRQVLLNIREHGYNPAAEMRGQVTGGLFINWKMDDPSQTNDLKQGMDGVTAGSHDPQVDLYYLNALAEYHTLHPEDHSFDGDIQKALPFVLNDFASYNLYKGWIYFYLLRTGTLLHNGLLIDEAHNVAQNYYNHWYDPTAGLVYNRAHSPGPYNVEHALNSGAALIDAGQRWKQSAWVQAGVSSINHVLAAALDPKYHLFYNEMNVFADGHQEILNYQAKPSTQGNSVEALVVAYNLTHNRHYLDVAEEVLQGMFSSRLWDQTNQGLYFALDMNTGQLENGYKETRGQTLSLIGLYRYNLAMRQLGQSQLLLDKQAQLINVLTNHFYQSTYHGFFYRVTPTFQIHHSSPGTGIGVEDYFTTEAMGTAMDALQQTEFAQLQS